MNQNMMMRSRQNVQALNSGFGILAEEDDSGKEKIRDKKMFRLCFHKRTAALRYLILVALLWIVTKNNFLLIRKFYVAMHYRVAPTVSAFGFPLDLSEGAIYKHLPSGVTFPKGQGGCVWDVGANNGIFNSNSFYLIHTKTYHAWLFEPDAATFLQLRENYASHPRVKLHNFALSSKTEIDTLRLFPMGFENTIRQKKANQADKMEYSYDISVQNATLLCQQQREAISNGLCDVASDEGIEKKVTYTVLSIDAEGVDWKIFRSAHKMGFRWDLLITEGRKDEPAKLGYKLVLEKAYNAIYEYRGLDGS